MKKTATFSDLIVSNGQLIRAEDPGRNVESGVVYAANADRFTGATYNEPLTQFTVGWEDPENLQALLDFLASPVPVERRFEYKKNNNLEYFEVDANNEDIRAIGQDPHRVEYTHEDEIGRVYNKSLMTRVDLEEQVEGWQEDYTQRLLQRLYRSEYYRAINLALNAANDTPVTWFTGGDTISNPDADIRAMLTLAANDSGVRPNRLLFGETSWQTRQAAYENANVYAGGFNAANLSMEDLAKKLKVDQIMEAKARYQSSATAKSLFLGETVLAFFALPGAKKNDPSHFKRFVGNTVGGGPFRVFVRQEAQYSDIIVEHFSNVLLTDDQGIEKLTVTEDDGS